MPCSPVSVKNVVPKRALPGPMPSPSRRAYSLPWPTKKIAPRIIVAASHTPLRAPAARAIVPLLAKRAMEKIAVRPMSRFAFAVASPASRYATYASTIARKKTDSDAMKIATPSKVRSAVIAERAAINSYLSLRGAFGPRAGGGR